MVAFQLQRTPRGCIVGRFGVTEDGMAGKPRSKVRCGAIKKTGEPCRAPVVPGKKRCKFHGGLSTGPRTEAGRQAVANAQRQRAAAWRAACEEADAAGLPRPRYRVVTKKPAPRRVDPAKIDPALPKFLDDVNVAVAQLAAARQPGRDYAETRAELMRQLRDRGT